MSNSDRVITDLLNALDVIERRAEQALAMPADLRGSVAFISGVAAQAIANVRRLQVRNADGYPVLRGDENSCFPVLEKFLEGR
jgi:hypothetical protein